MVASFENATFDPPLLRITAAQPHPLLFAKIRERAASARLRQTIAVEVEALILGDKRCNGPKPLRNRPKMRVVSPARGD